MISRDEAVTTLVEAGAPDTVADAVGDAVEMISVHADDYTVVCYGVRFSSTPEPAKKSSAKK